MTDNHKEKYYRINLDWPNKSGKMQQVLATQKRLIQILARNKKGKEIDELLLSVAEGYDVCHDLLNWMREMLTEVGADSVALCDGAKLRNTIQWQGEFLSELMDARNNRIDQVLNGLKDDIAARKNQATA